MSIGPEWGNAHIDVHADTSPMRRELRAAAAAAGKEFGPAWGDAAETSLGKEMTVLGRHIETALKKQGRDGGIDYAEAFEDGVRRRLRRFDMNIIESALSGDWSFAVEQFGGLEEAIDGVKAKFAEMREQSDLSEESFQDMEGSLRKWAQSVRNDNAFTALHDSALTMNKEWDRQKKESADFDRALTQAFNDIEDAAHSMNKEFDKSSTAKAREEYASLSREAKALHFEITKMLKAHDDEDRALARQRDSAHELANEWVRVRNATKKAREDFSLFGRLHGNRNNFLNLLGGMSRAVEGFGDGLGAFIRTSGPAVANWSRGVIDAFSQFGDVIKAGRADGIGAGLSVLGDKFSVLSNALAGGRQGGLPGILLSVASGFLQVGQAVAGIVLAIGSLNVIAPAITGLGGIVTALAGSLSYAIAGFLLPLGPMLLAAAGGVGALALAFVGAGDEIKKFTDPFKEFADTFRPLVQEALFKTLAKDLERFKSVLNGFVGPLLISSAGALSQVFEDMTRTFERPEIKATLDTLAGTLPTILTNMGLAFTNLLSGVLGFFAAISPQVGAVAASIADITARFEEWANSTEGQTAIADFFKAASDSAQILWDLVINVGAALGTLFSQGKETGDGFLQKISDIIAEFVIWANSDEGRAKIAGWMQFARDLASKLWDAIETVGTAINNLDTPENREALLALIGAFTSILDAVGRVAAAVAPLAPAFRFAFGVISALAQSAAGLIEDVAGAVEGLIRALGRIKVPDALRTVGQLIGKVGGAAPPTAVGGTFSSPQVRQIAEAGPEAVVPLDRPLSQVDPSVRWLSALAQGKIGGLAVQGSGSGGRTITVMPGAVTVTAPVRNEALVANMVLDGLVSRVK